MTDAKTLDSVAISEIADKFGLDAEKLDSVLRDLVLSRCEVVYMQANDLGAKGSKRLLGRMKRQASKLKQALNEVPIMSTFHADLFQKYKHFYLLKNELDDLDSAIDSITPKSKRGKTAAALKQDLFITHMAMFWWRQTGKAPSYTTDPVTENKTSDFLDFLAAVARLLDIDTAPLPERFSVLKRNETIYKDFN